MKARRIILILVGILALATPLVAEELMVFGNYNIPLNPPETRELEPASDIPAAAAENLAFGLGYKFWGIFVVSGHMYNEIIYGADNFLNIERLRPIGVFSAGLGLEIPLGSIGLMLDWQRFFTGTSSQAGIYSLSNSFKWGLTFEVDRHIGFEAYTRKLSNFSGRAGEEFSSYSKETQFNTFGLGVIIRLLNDEE